MTLDELMRAGIAAAQAQKPAEAVEWFQKAHAAAPGEIAPKAWLGQSLCAIGRRVDGVEYLRQSGRQMLEPGAIGHSVERALEVIGRLQQWGDYEGALELCRLAVLEAPRNAQAQQLLAVTCGQLNLTQEALAAGAKALELRPDDQMMQVLQASLEADSRSYADARDRLTSLMDSKPADREAFRAHKELARIYDALGEYDSVFPHLDASAEIAPRLTEFRVHDPRIIPNLIDANFDGYSAELLGRWSASDFSGEPRAPTFVIGFFRSGTTLTQEVLGAHPDVFVADEAGLIGAVKQELNDLDGSDATESEKLSRLDKAGIERLRAAYWAAARASCGKGCDAEVFVDKFTMNTVDIGLINCVFPDARVIFMLRDPRDVCLSSFMQLMVPTPTTIHLLTWRGTAALYARVMDWWLEVRERLTLKFIEVRYEDAVTDFEGVYRKIFAFVGLLWDPRVAHFHKSVAGRFIASPSRNQVSRPLYQSSLARWRRFEARYAEVAEFLDPFVEDLGYSA